MICVNLRFNGVGRPKQTANQILGLFSKLDIKTESVLYERDQKNIKPTIGIVILGSVRDEKTELKKMQELNAIMTLKRWKGTISKVNFTNLDDLTS